MGGVTSKAMKEHGRNIARAMNQSKGKSSKEKKPERKK